MYACCSSTLALLGGKVVAQEAAADPGGLEEIIVTAQRREESLQRAAIPVSAVSGDELINASVSDTENLSKLVPSLVIQPAGGSTMNMYLRGVGTLQGNAFGENPVAFNVDGVYIARPTGPVGTFYDLERIEVVKGPQGTLYGRNATGGAVNVLPKRPELGEFSGDVNVEYGNYDALKGSGSLNAPLGESWALRIAGQAVDRSGYLSDDYADEVGEAARVSLLFEPSSTFSTVLVADYFHQGGAGNGSVLMPGLGVSRLLSGLCCAGAGGVHRRLGPAEHRSAPGVCCNTVCASVLRRLRPVHRERLRRAAAR